jgi:hypothetical protein
VALEALDTLVRGDFDFFFISYVCNIILVEIAQGLFVLKFKDVSYVLNIGLDKISTINKLQVANFQTCQYGFFHTSLKVMKTVQSITLYLQDVRLKDMLSIYS